MKVLLIEDEIPAAERLRELILQYDKTIQVEGSLESNEAIITWAASHEMPDLIFSDIELLDGPVFYALERMPKQVPIIFTTAYDHYALEAFNTHGISYLLKPFELKDVRRAMEKFYALQANFQAENSHELIADLKKVLLKQPVKYKSRLSIKAAKGIYLLEVADICCIKAENGIIYACRADKRKVPLSDSISNLQEVLDPSVFYRINRSEIVNMNFIEKVESYFNDRLAIFIKGQKAPLVSSAAKTPGFRKWLNQL